MGTRCGGPIPEARQLDALTQPDPQHDPLQLAGAHVDDLVSDQTHYLPLMNKTNAEYPT